MLQGVSLSDFASAAQIIEALVIIASLVFITAQLRQSTELAKAENVRELTTHAAAFNASIYQDRALTTLWHSHGKQFDTLDHVDRQRYRDLLAQWLLLHMNIYYQWKRGLLDPEIYHPWQKDLQFTVAHHNVHAVAKDISTFFPGPFGQELLRLQRAGTGDPGEPQAARNQV